MSEFARSPSPSRGGGQGLGGVHERSRWGVAASPLSLPASPQGGRGF